jgi:cysteine synthase A
MASSVCSSVLEAIGNTPLIHLQRLHAAGQARVLAKLEALNPGGSIKSRTAWAMIRSAEAAGQLRPDAIIVEPTSGNQGIGLAMVAAVRGYRARLIMPDCVSLERCRLIEAYGAEAVLVPSQGDIGSTIRACVELAMEMQRNDPRVFVPQQFQNPANPSIHRETTGREFLAQVDGPIDAFVAGVGTGGTLTGVGEVLKARFPGLLVVATEPENAAILSGGPIGEHEQQGIGDGIIPDVLNLSLIDRVVVVSDADAMATARLLARREGLMVGVSSGTNVWAALAIAKELGEGKTVVTVLPDTAERYFSTPLFANE